MNSIIKIALAATLAIFAQNVKAQEEIPQEQKMEDSLKQRTKIDEQITQLKLQKSSVEDLEKSELKYEVEYINKVLETGRITEEEAEQRKRAAAKKHALNIQNQVAIINNEIALLQRNGVIGPNRGTQVLFGVGHQDENGKLVFGLTVDDGQARKVQYDRRTYGETVFAFGLNNVLSDNSEIGDNFSVGKSTFVEWGYAWKTRVFKNSGALQFKYGLSLQTNKLSVKRNETLVITDGVGAFEEFLFDLKKSQIRTTNLVVPLHFEFGGWKKKQEEDYVRYSINGKFRMGIGGYVGVRLSTQQKLKYKAEGERIKSKSRQDFGGDNLVYGLSSYVRLTGDLSLYGKYDLSSAIETQSLGEVNNVSLGLRLDL